MTRILAAAALLGLAACAGLGSTLTFESRATWSAEAPAAWQAGAWLAWRTRAREAPAERHAANEQVAAPPHPAPACALPAACTWERAALDRTLVAEAAP